VWAYRPADVTGLLRHLDRALFEIIVYHTGASVDEETHWAIKHADRFVQGPKPVKSWLEEARQDRPDVMFYPEVGMDPATCALAALRLAPTQVASWGHPVTTGLPSIDLFLSGEQLERPDAAQDYRERLVRLPGTGVCTESPAIEPRPWTAPGRRPDVVRFALCQQPIKFDPMHDGLLAHIAIRWSNECRSSADWLERRESIRRAAPLADGNIRAVKALERALSEAVIAARARGAS
jgi:protein O-GlcNAc transferase